MAEPFSDTHLTSPSEKQLLIRPYNTHLDASSRLPWRLELNKVGRSSNLPRSFLSPFSAVGRIPPPLDMPSLTCLLLLALLSHLVTGYQLPSPYVAKPPFSYGHYCNGSDPYWWEGYLYVDLWGSLDVYENSTIRVSQFDAIEVHNDARLLAETEARIVLQNWTRASFYAQTTFRNSSSVSLTEHSSLETKSGLTLGLNSNLTLARYSSVLAEGGLRLGDRAKTVVSEFSQVLIGTRSNLSLASEAVLTVETFSSLILGPSSGLRVENDVTLTLRNHAVLEVANGTWVRLTKNAVILERTRLVISGSQDQEGGRSIGLEYTSDSDFAKYLI